MKLNLKKPDIFLGIVMCMLVLAAVLCIVILWVQKSNSEPTDPGKPNTTTEAPIQTDEAGNPVTPDSNPSDTTEPQPSNPVVEVKDINAAGLKAALDESLRGLTSEWQVMVIDPVKELKVSSAVNCDVDSWMTANRMTQVFIMGTVFQQANDGTLTLDAVLDDVKAMMTNNDTYAADRLTEQVGGGDAAKGRDNVKAFAVSNGVKLGFNRPLTGSSSSKNYVTAQQTAMILNLICRGELVSEAASQQMLDILLSIPAENSEIDLSGLAGDGIRCGFISDVESGTCICTMGVVQLQNRCYVISVVCNNPVTTDGAKKKVVELLNLTLPFFQD